MYQRQLYLVINSISTMLNNTAYGFKIKANANTRILYLLYAVTQKQIHKLIKTKNAFSSDIHMDFRLEKCKTLIIQRRLAFEG